MSLLPALDESEQGSGHGWSNASRFGTDGQMPQGGQQWDNGQAGQSNLYHQLINQNNTGDVPNACVEEEVVYDEQPQQDNTSYTQSPQSHAVVPKHQQKKASVQQQQQQHVPQQHQQQSPQHYQQQQSQHHPQQQQSQHHPQQQHYQHQKIVHQVGKNAQKVMYTVVQPSGGYQSQGGSHQQQNLASPHARQNFNTKQQQFQNASQNQNLNRTKSAEPPVSEVEMNRRLQANQELIENNKKQLELAAASLGINTALPQNDSNSPQTHNTNSPQVQQSYNNCDYVGSMRVQTPQQQLHQSQNSDSATNVKQLLMLNNSQTKKNDVKLDNGANNSTNRSLLKPGGSPMPNAPMINLSGNNRQKVVQGQQSINTQLNYRPNMSHVNQRNVMGGANQSPVQVPSISTNQNQNLLSNPMTNINKDNVVLEGGGQFEEGQAYMIRDKSGQSRTMIWRQGHFVPPPEENTIQHSTIDSSQRGRGRGKNPRGRGRGQGHPQQGQAMGMHMSQGNMRGGRSPQMMNIRQQSPMIRHQAARPPSIVHVDPRHQFHMRQQRPQGMQQQSPRPQVMAVRPQGIVVSQGSVHSPQARLLNLMPAAQGSQTKQPTAGQQTNVARVPESTEVIPEETTEPVLGTDSDNKDDKPEDLPQIPADSNAVAICQFCGTCSEDKYQCESCKRKFTSKTKYKIKTASIKEGPEEKRRKVDSANAKKDGETNTAVNKKLFYGNRLQEQNQVYTTILNVNNNASVGTMIGGRNPRIIRSSAGGRGRGRGRGRSRVVVPETVTISSDEDEGGEHHHSKKKTQQMSAPATPVSKGNKSPSHADQADCPESPLIPEIPLSTKDKRAGRRDKMEDEKGASRSSRERSLSPVEVQLHSHTVRVGTFKGAPVEPILLSKTGLNFFIEGITGTYKFHIYPQEIQQCLARFDDNGNMLYFLTTQSCGIRTRKDLKMRQHVNQRQHPPEPYFDPCSIDMTHQMVAVFLKKIDIETQVQFQKHMDTFKSWGKQGDEGFFMELSAEESEEIMKQSTRKTQYITVAPIMMGDHQYSQQENEDRQSRSPSPPKIGFAGPIIKLLTYPPPPEKGGHSITNEDLYCLQEGEFLNDVIIDFYLKYLLLERLSAEDRERTHIFSSFFYKRLTQKIRGAAIDEDPCLTLPVKRHARVKTWTRKLDLFKKDFIVVPINEHAHWFLAIICFPGLQEPVSNPFIPKPLTMPLLDTMNVPTPPQPTEENMDDMETEESESPVAVKQVPVEKPAEQSPVDNIEESKDGDSKPVDTTNTGDTSSTGDMCKAGDTVVDTPTDTDTEKKQPGTQSTEDNKDTTESTNGDKPEDSSTTTPPPAVETETQSTSTGTDTPPDKTDTATGTGTDSKPATPSIPNTRPFMGKPCRGVPVKVEEGETLPEDAATGIKQPCIIIFDSLLGPSRSRIVQVLKEYLQVEWTVKKGGELNKTLIKGCVPKVPQQNNYSDCGVFMLQYVESFFEDPIQDFITPMKGIWDWFSGPRIDGKREEIRDLIISLKAKHESKSEGKDSNS